MAPQRISPGVYRVNGKTINAPTGAAAQAAYDKKYGAKVASPPAAAPTGTATAAPPPPAPNTAATVTQAQTDLATNANNAAIANLGASTTNQQQALTPAQLNAAAGFAPPQQPAPAAAPGAAADPSQAAISNLGVSNQLYTGNAGGAQQLAPEVTNLQNAFDPVLSARQSSGDLNADRGRIEQDIYGRLTRDLEGDYKRSREQNEQTLRNKGIPFSADPNSRYQQELGALDRRFDDARLTARQTATQLGGEEFSRQFGIGETLRQNQLGEQSGVRNQRIGEQTALSAIGQPGYQASQSNLTNQQQLANQLAIANIQARTSKDVARIQNKRRIGGGGGTTSSAPDPFPL